MNVRLARTLIAILALLLVVFVFLQPSGRLAAREIGSAIVYRSHGSTDKPSHELSEISMKVNEILTQLSKVPEVDFDLTLELIANYDGELKGFRRKYPFYSPRVVDAEIRSASDLEKEVLRLKALLKGALKSPKG